MRFRLQHVLVGCLGVAALVAAVAAAGSAGGEDAERTERDTTTSIFRVAGMTCGGCEAAVRRIVGRLDGVASVEASYEDGTATATYHPGAVTPAEIIAAIEGLGYEAELADDEPRAGRDDA